MLAFFVTVNNNFGHCLQEPNPCHWTLRRRKHVKKISWTKNLKNVCHECSECRNSLNFHRRKWGLLNSLRNAFIYKSQFSKTDQSVLEESSFILFWTVNIIAICTFKSPTHTCMLLFKVNYHQCRCHILFVKRTPYWIFAKFIIKMIES